MILEQCYLDHPKQKGTQFQVSVESLLPGEAKQLLEKSEKAAGGEAVLNRKVRPSLVKRLAHDLTEGRWVFNGQTIVIDQRGFILDGQHRLHACVQAGIPLFTMTVRGLDPQIMTTLDSGESRSKRDVLGMAGMVEANILAGAITLVKAYRDGTIATTHRHRTPVSNTEILELAEGPYLPVVGSVAWVSEITRRQPRIMTKTEAAALHAILQDAAPAHVVGRWFSELLQGRELSGNRLKLHHRLQTAYYSKQRKDRLTRQERMAFTIKAWNADRTGEEIGRFIFAHSKKRRERFPRPI